MSQDFESPSGNREREIFLLALEKTTALERAAFLDGACHGDADLRNAVDLLLANANDSLLDHVAEEARPTQFVPVTEKPGERIGRYKLLQKIGEGGMGVVYMAEQTEPVKRKVALKIIKLGMDTKQVVARFEAERQALAMMDHPNIARVLDGGATETGRPYFVMELVQGVPITEFCDKNKLKAKERLKLFIQVCHAIQSAHQKGIIHRDIKPSNVLVTLHHGEPMPKVIDFGVAKATNQKLTEKTLFTNYATMIGTPAYMSPEQAEMSSMDVDTRTDVYALGVLLYELLTGTTPFPEKRLRSLGYGEMQRVIMEEEPERPSNRLSTMANEQKTVVARNCGEELASLSNMLKGEIDWIVMKCLEKDRTRRYETANGLATDIQRHLQQEPVSAVAPSALYLLSKYARKHRVGLATAATIVFALIAGTVLASWQAVRATRAEQHAKAQRSQAVADRDRARQAESQANAQRQKATEEQQRADAQADRANRLLYAAHMNLAHEAWDEANVMRVLELLDLHRPEPGQPDTRGFEWFYLDNLLHRDLLTLKGHNARVSSVAFSPDGKRIASRDGMGMVKVWDTTSGEELITLYALGAGKVAFSPDGKWLAGSGKGTVKIWDATSYEEWRSFQGETNNMWALVFSPDGRRVASAGAYSPLNRGELKVWDVISGREILTLKRPYGFWSVAFSPDGKRLAFSSGDWGYTTKPCELKICDASSGQETLTLKGHGDGPGRNAIWSVAFSPDGNRLASAGRGTVKLWDATSGQEILTLDALHNTESVTFSPDGKRLAAAGWRQMVKVWDVTTGKEMLAVKGHNGPINQVAFSPDGKRLASASDDRTVEVWDATSSQEALTLKGHTEFVGCVVFSPDGKRVASASNDKTVKVWDIAGRREMLTLKGHTDRIWRVAWSPDGKRLASASHDQTVRIWDATSGREVFTVHGHTGQVLTVGFSPDGRRLASAGQDRTLKIWDAEKGRELLTLTGHTEEVNGIAFSPDGKRLASASGDRTVKVWDATTGEETLVLPHDSAVMTLAFSADGKQLASATWNQKIKVWDSTTGEAMLGWNGHSGVIRNVAFSLDGKRLASASEDRTVKLWDLTSGQEMLTLKGHDGEVLSVAFSPDGNRLASASADHTVKLWDATPRSPESTPAAKTR